ncbi:hypothetical protein QGN29_02015 [Temperatibacter marinus]|uniref:Uncharacterized protein n=1 Tax=Temperatibacter marinus TaxID=1456591 RepID=A0AA52H9F5_9PROT|nr:hypothetical protein [Temperatibacter marinus]WND03141.1 hypothetical protein QGN29_02015 [Temperatibacter marinus]
MSSHIFCPLCQPEAISGEMKATYTIAYDGGVLIECSSCGNFRTPSMKMVGTLKDPTFDQDDRHLLKRLIMTENSMGMVARLHNQILH